MSSPTPTYTNLQMWQLTRAAIAEILSTGQTVSYQGRSLSMANLGELRKAEADYLALANQDVACRRGRNRLTYIVPV